MQVTWIWRSAALAALGTLGACGGGGGGGGGGVPLPVANAPRTGLVTLSGTATYVSIPNSPTTGGLAYAAAVAKPIRGATVEIVNGAGSSVLATVSTDDNGNYAVPVPPATEMLVRVKAQLKREGGAANWDVTVRDNTQSDAIYALETAPFTSGLADATRDLQAPSGWDGTRYAEPRVAAPFAVLDTVYAAQLKMLSAAPATAFPPLRVFWSPANLPAAGNPALGQIGTTSFTTSAAGRAIYVLGKEDVDTDEYDASVVAHEWGHYYQSAFSRDDSPGGGHRLTDLLDRRVAFSEGWGNAWAGIALGRSTYTDSAGPSQARGASIDLNSNGAPTPGWYREGSIQAIFWRLNAQAGLQPIHAAMTSPAFREGVPVTSIHSFAAAFRVAAPGAAATLNGLLAGEQINAAPGDPYGQSETNDGGVATALPMYLPAAVGGTTPACVSNAAGSGNKLGNYVYLRFANPTAGTRTITVAGPAGADPDFALYAGRLIDASDGLGTSESKAVSLPAGDNVLVLSDYNHSSVNTCFNVSIQ